MYHHSNSLHAWGLNFELLELSLTGKTDTDLPMLSNDDKKCDETSDTPNSEETKGAPLLETTLSESFLMTSLRSISSIDKPRFSDRYLLTEENVSIPSWFVQRLGYEFMHNHNSKILTTLQNNHFLKLMTNRSIKCMPRPPRVELIEKKVVNIGFEISCADSVEMLRDKHLRDVLGQCFLKAAEQLISLHQVHRIFHGGLSPETIIYSGYDRATYFINWSHSCSSVGIQGRVVNTQRYYYNIKKTSTFDELVMSDVFALLLIFADITARFNNQHFIPSCNFMDEYKAKSPADYNEWVLSS